jgi:ankyrin repeat protein
MGFGFILSVYLPSHLRQKLCMAMCTFQVKLISRTNIALHCCLGVSKTVPLDAEIFRSARGGLTENVKRLLSLRMASATDTTIFGTTLLHSASKSGSTELVRLLIQEGADVNARDEDGESPLHGAMAKSDNYDIARILIEHGADLSSQAVDGKTPFHNIFNNTISQVLMRDGWLENMLPDSEVMSITHFLAWSSTSTAEIFQRGHSYDDAELLSADSSGRTCLHFAASRGNLEVLSYLVRQVSLEDLEKKDIRGRTPFHYAVESSRAAGVIDILTKRGCNIHAADHTGRNALHWAARSNNFEAVRS